MSETIEKVGLILFGAVLGAVLPPVRDLVAWLVRKPWVRVEVGTGEGFFTCTQFGSQVEDMRGDGGFPPNFMRTIYHDGRYVRVRVMNRRWAPWNPQTAQTCVGYLVAVERWDGQRQAFTNAGYDDFLRLAWSHNGDVRGMDLLPDTPHWLDVLYAHEGRDQFLLGTVERPNRYESGFGSLGYYRVVIQLSGENVRSKRLNLYLHWSGSWQTMEVLDETGWQKRKASLSAPATPAQATA